MENVSSEFSKAGEQTSKAIKINRKKLIFYSVFLLTFFLSGLITMLSMGIIPYRMGLVSLLVIPLFLSFGIKVDKVFIGYIILTAFVILSGLLNSIPPVSMLLFMRILVFSFLIYQLVELYIHPGNISKILKVSVLIGMIQLPLVVLQQLTYEILPNSIKSNLIQIDFDFGSFNFKGDSAMGF